MKTIYFSFGLLLILAFSCKNETPRTTAITVLIDVTDENFQSPDFVSKNSLSLLEMMDINKDDGKFSGGQVKISLINDLSDSHSELISLEPGKPGLMGENPLIRNDEVEKFCNNLETIFSKIIASADWGTNESKIYQKVARELNDLNNSEQDKKIMVVYSDMLENSKLFSFYGPDAKTKIDNYISSPDKTIENFSASAPKVNYLNNVEIIVITNRTRDNDEMVNLSERFWKSIFNEMGAEVQFLSSLN